MKFVEYFEKTIWPKIEKDRNKIGVTLIILGIFTAIYVGLWVCFVGGIVAILEQAKQPEISSGVVAWSVVRIFGSTILGCISGACVAIPGYLMLK